MRPILKPMHATQPALTSITSSRADAALRNAMQSRLIRRDGEAVIIESRQTNGETWAVVLPQSSSDPLTGPFIASATGVARQLFGSHVRVLSPALTAEESVAFSSAGYRVRSNLHLLILDLEHTPTPERRRAPATTISTYRRHDEAAVLRTDLLAFGSGAEMDRHELASAFLATPRSRLRVARINGVVAGFALFGRADRRGYLQRLAVHPDAQGRGIARLLITDGLRWCRLRRVQRVVVNTEHGNDRALGLYRSFGFTLSATGLQIMEHRVTTDGFTDAPGSTWR
jgi:ribosomal protein S18 acetylase RimI-like enzyme